MESQIILGDCREVLKSQPDDHFDSVVTDPPSGIGFLSLNWDTFKPTEDEEGVEGRSELLAFQNFLVEVFREVFRVLKPGAFGLVWALPRTSHHTGMALERVGFEIRDRVAHLFGCLSEDTELLTERGWEHYSSLVTGTLAVCYDASTGDLSWQPIQQIYVYPYNDTAYRLQGDNTDQLVSRGHHCLVERGGKQVLACAETLQQQESIPILEDVHGLLKALPVPQSNSGNQEQSLLQRLCKEEDRGSKQRLQGATSYLSNLPSRVHTEWSLATAQGQVLQPFVSSPPLCHYRTDGESRGVRLSGLDYKRKSILQGKDDRGAESSLEGWSNNIGPSGEVCGSEVCEMPPGIQSYVREEWLRRRTQTSSSQDLGSMFDKVGDCSPYQPRSEGQPSRESHAVCYQSGPQAIRASRFTTTNMVRVEATHYKGVVWCVRTTTGCFVARRVGKAFITGNSGYKKGLDIEKSFLDKGLLDEAARWSGYHTGLKPALEDWWLIRKPLEGTIIENILRHGTGALNIDSSRVFTDWDEPDRPDTWKRSGHTSKPEAVKVAAPPGDGINCHPLGRYPADFILSHSQGCKRVGTKVIKGDPRGNCKGTRPGGFYAPGSDSGDGKPNAYVYGDQEIPLYECVEGCPVSILDRNGDNSRYFKTFDPDPEANFIYQAKPSTSEKNADLDGGFVNEHKTVKSLKLMTYLVRLVTPQGGRILDPFAGSGTTLVAAAELGFGFLGIERDDKTWPVLKSRIDNTLRRVEETRERDEDANLMYELESE